MSELSEFEQHAKAAELALKWFEIHASQRMSGVNFFLLVAGFCIAGYFTALEAKMHVAAMGLGILLAFLSGCFKLLDRRTSQLIWYGESSLRAAIKGMSELSPIVADFADKANTPGRMSYRRVFNLLFVVLGTAGIAGSFFAWDQL